MSISVLAALFGLGGVVGVLAGLLGIGGGMLIVPFMILALETQAYPGDLLIKIAIATALSTMMFTSLSSVRAHHGRGGVRWDLVSGLAPGIVLGTLLGAQLVPYAQARWLELFFGLFIGWNAYRMVRPAARTVAVQPALPGRPALAGVGGLIGVASALLGAGGGFLTIPYLTRHGVAVAKAVGTSAACGVPIAFAGAIGYAFSGRSLTAGLPDPMLGLIHLPALAAISAASILTAPVGVRLAHTLPVATVRRLFVVLLSALALYMLWRAWQDA